MKFKDEDMDEDYFLGSNYHQHSSAATTVTAYTYINKMVKTYLDGDCSVSRERPAAWSYMPADECNNTSRMSHLGLYMSRQMAL